MTERDRSSITSGPKTGTMTSPEAASEPEHYEMIPAERVPAHIAIIMDGNGRWAAQRGLARIEGHEHGTENIRRITHMAGELGVKCLTLWAFSTENWRRPKEEVEGLMRILGNAIESETAELHRQGAQLRHIGDLDALPTDLRRSVLDAMELTKDNAKLVLTLAFNYGGRQELLHAIRQMIKDGVAPDDVTEESLEQRLYTSDLPDADLIIRTSGECRLSNFLLWQGAYAELYFSPKFWPDFGPEDLREAVLDFSRRERRFGAVSAAALNR
jgi:undecaprenyl diphosphate synthase